MGRLRLPKVTHSEADSLRQDGAGSVHRSAFIFRGKNTGIGIWDAKNSTLLNGEHGTGCDNRRAARVRSHLDQLVLRR